MDGLDLQWNQLCRTASKIMVLVKVYGGIDIILCRVFENYSICPRLKCMPKVKSLSNHLIKLKVCPIDSHAYWSTMTPKF